MSTLEVIKFRDVLAASSIPRLVPGLSVPTLELKGRDFRFAESVQLNDVSVPEFIVVDKQTIYAQIPLGVQQIRTVAIISSRFTTTKKASRVIFQIGNKTQKISGLLKLTQLFTKVLLQSPGSDVFDPEFGGGLQDLVGKITSTKRSERVLAAIAQSIQQTTSQIRRAQLDTPQLPLEERLLSATLLDVRTVQSLDEARARVQIDNVAGQTGVSAIEL